MGTLDLALPAGRFAQHLKNPPWLAKLAVIFLAQFPHLTQRFLDILFRQCNVANLIGFTLRLLGAVLLTRGSDALEPRVDRELRRLLDRDGTVTLVGDADGLPDAVMRDHDDTYQVRRVAGADAYATARVAALDMERTGRSQTAVVAGVDALDEALPMVAVAAANDWLHPREPWEARVGGDLALFGHEPAACVDRLQALPGAVFVQGNTDRYLAERRPDAGADPRPPHRRRSDVDHVAGVDDDARVRLLRIADYAAVLRTRGGRIAAHVAGHE